jgi:hypothetical protein
MIGSASRNKLTGDSVLGEDPLRERAYKTKLLRLCAINKDGDTAPQ